MRLHPGSFSTAGASPQQLRSSVAFPDSQNYKTMCTVVQLHAASLLFSLAPAHWLLAQAATGASISPCGRTLLNFARSLRSPSREESREVRLLRRPSLHSFSERLSPLPPDADPLISDSPASDDGNPSARQRLPGVYCGSKFLADRGFQPATGNYQVVTAARIGKGYRKEGATQWLKMPVEAQSRHSS